ncbi:error-prone DNA polymerase [Propionibacterium cyclohexanicum]|uniref:DNA polymerase III subunit alpha n=1 Tax=Propionibacterium cyclohexanicum TaxID=64702 RepID=A0A1H9PIY9_9ACTN|nr:DNA polymerase III subunit alpha [Propionibacterium cyclohexanicum]SER48148.1 error-prone DNA polymerase [Propionibacterium cyclohexanicum]
MPGSRSARGAGAQGEGTPFVHLRVASAFSLQYGASQPAELVEAAASMGMDALGLTDRDGLYGAVGFAQACRDAGIAPVIGVDLAVPGAEAGVAASRRANPAKGGRLRDEQLPRVVVLARSRQGWAALCRLVSAAHGAGERGKPLVSAAVVGQWAAAGQLSVLLGPDSGIGRLLIRGDEAGAERELARWREAVPHERITIAVADLLAGSGAYCEMAAAAMLRFADAHHLGCVLTNHVRMTRPGQAPLCDVLDAARRLTPLSVRSTAQRTGEDWLKDGARMSGLAARISALAGRDDAGQGLLAMTGALARECMLDPVADIGLGEIHLPPVPGAEAILRERCRVGLAQRYGADPSAADRLRSELEVIEGLGFSSYFLTIAQVVDMVHGAGLRCTARGSGVGSLVDYLLGISGIEPMAYGLVMERFLSPLRSALPDIDLDVESARRTDIYRMVLERFGHDRVACVAMVETYRVRHALRDVAAALSMSPGEIDALAKAFPHIRARDVRHAVRELPELRRSGLTEERLGMVFDLVEGLDGLPRHLALHPCGVIISDQRLLDRTPVQTSASGFPMSQFAKDEVEAIGLLKLDILGVRMQSAMAHTLDEIGCIEGPEEVPRIDELEPFDDPEVYELIAHSQTLGCFQIESPGQRELVGKFGPSDFNDIIIDISLFRPGPVKSDMVIPFLDARAGWSPPRWLHERLRPILEETYGVVVFHEQVIKIIAALTGVTLALADEVRRALGSPEGQQRTRDWFLSRARVQGYEARDAERIWQVLASFASFGFCKAHAAAFALPTYQSAWLKCHWPAPFLAGILTHDPGMYPKRLLLEEARRMNIEILGIDVNACDGVFHALRVAPDPGAPAVACGLPDARGWAIRLALADVKDISDEEIMRIVAGQPYTGLSDFVTRAAVSAPVTENLILVGGFDALYGIDPDSQRWGGTTRRDLLLALAELNREARASRRAHVPSAGQPSFDFTSRDGGTAGPRAGQPGDVVPSGLPEMSRAERTRAEIAVLGMDVSRHIVEFYRELLDALGVVPASRLFDRRNRDEVLVAGVKIATQTPPVRSGRRVVFLSLDDGTGPCDVTFFEDAQDPYAGTVFSSWLLLARGEIRRTGPRGISLTGSGAWDLAEIYEGYCRVLADRGRAGAMEAVRARLAWTPGASGQSAGARRMLLHPSGFVQSPYADIAVAGDSPAAAPRKLWHASPGSSGP